MKHKLIVLGDDFWNTLGIIRSLGEAGERPYFINVCSHNSFVKRSRYIKQYWQVESVAEGVEVMKREFAHEEFKPVVFCSSDPIISYVDNHYDELSQRFILPNAAEKQGEINRLMDKDVMLAVADKVGILHPACISLDITTLERSDINGLKVNYPCITKPLMSIQGSKADIVPCGDADALWDTLQKILIAGCHRVQVQDYITKEYEMLLSGYALPNGMVIIPGIITKLKEYPMGFTSYASIDPDTNKYIPVELVQNYVREMKYSGIFSLEFLLCKGEMYFMEINLRNDGNSYAPTYGGVNTHYLWAKGITGDDVLEVHTKIQKVYEFQQESNALNYYHFLGGGYPAFFKEFFKADFHLHFSIKDPAPALWRFVLNKIFK